MTILDREQLFEKCTPIQDGQADGYYSKMGMDMKPIKEIIAQEGNLLVLNNLLNIFVKKERLERSVTKCVPMGRNLSHRTLYSERVGELNQDFDSKEFTGGALPLKTETRPVFTARATAGVGDVAQNVGYGNAVYYDESDVQLIADNFAAMNKNLNNLSITFRGKADIYDLESVINVDFILDNVN